MRCAYRDCGKSRSPGLKLYGFPIKDEERCKRWIINSGNQLDIPRKKYDIRGLCEDHFIKEDFVNETKHRLIQIAVPKHYTDPLGHARRKERGLDVDEDEPNSGDSEQILSLSEKLQRDIGKLQMDQNSNRPVVSSSWEIGQKECCEGNTEEQQSTSSRHGLFDWNGFTLQLMSKKDNKIECLVRKIDKDDPRGSRDLEFRWHNSKNKKKVKCYSRKNNIGDSSCRVPSQSNCNQDTSTCQSVKVEDKDSWLKNDVSSSSDVWKLEEDCKDIPDMLLSSEYEFMDQDVKDEGISECQLQWSEEEEDKSLIRIVDISKLQADTAKEENKNLSPVPRIHKRRVGRKRRLIIGMKSIIWSTETEKFMYIINRNRLQIRNLKSKLKKCHKELKKLRKKHADCRR